MNPASSWKLTVRRDGDGVTVLHAVTCDRKASLPDSVFGLPVKALGPRAFVADPGELEGEKVELLCGEPDGDFDNSRLEELSLPLTLETVGSYALIRCRSLRRLRLGDGIGYFGAGIFMSCRSLSSFELVRCGREPGDALAYIARELPGELDISVTDENGVSLRLIFPEYYEQLTESSAAHQFNFRVEGGGYPYHSVFVKNRLELSAYDALWNGFVNGEQRDDATPLRLAWVRLRYPEGLSPEAEENYRSYLRCHLRETLLFALREKDIQGLRLLLAETGITPEDVSVAADAARELRQTEALSLLLEKKHRLAPRIVKKSYDL